MNSRSRTTEKIQLSFNQKLGLLIPYVKKRITAQIKAVTLIVVYLMFFQTIVLDIPLHSAIVIVSGIAIVIIGLAFFMEGLFLGLMPLGETIGLKLPQKSKLPIILLFSFILGIGATYAEPAIGVLRATQSFVKAWNAPLLFLLLNKYADYLVYSVGVGVGIAVLFGMLRFLYGYSLKPFIYVIVSVLVAFSLWAFFEPNMKLITGLAWDCGAVTTGPITVPLVLALGIGICRIVSSKKMENAGFGVVTLASLFPIIAVLTLGASQVHKVPPPMNEEEFFSKVNRDKTLMLFDDYNSMIGYALNNANIGSQRALFDGNEEMLIDFIKSLKENSDLRNAVFGNSSIESLTRWVIDRGTAEQKAAVFTDLSEMKKIEQKYNSSGSQLNIFAVFSQNGISAAQAVLPLTGFLLFFLIFVLRERLPQSDKVFLGIALTLIGMGLFNIGNEIGLTKLGKQVGSKLPSSFKKIHLVNEKTLFNNFDENIVQTAIKPNGETEKYFFANVNNEYLQIPFKEPDYDQAQRQYAYTPVKGPLYGGKTGIAGYAVVLLFAFIMGYGATLAEPALNALGVKVEEITIGTFKKVVLMQAVAIGVGLGMTFGVVKIIWDIPLIWLLAPPYLLLLYLTKISSEEFVNIGWDSAGVTTGPVTVPLVLAMGLGIGSQVNVMEGFGILAMASVYPIVTFLLVAIYITKKRRELQKETGY
jgi:hypothetical protein